MRTHFPPLFPAAILASTLLGGCVSDAPAPSPAAAPTASKNQALLNNSASLLADLLKDEKNLNKILLIKGHSKELGTLVDAIAHAAAAGEDQLKILAQSDPALDLTALALPPGEQAARKGIAKTKEHDLLFSSGTNFAFNLLVTQTDALSYGSHLAEIAAKNAPDELVGRPFHALATTLDGLLQQVIAQMRSLPPK